jgi:hypothetical protein
VCLRLKEARVVDVAPHASVMIAFTVEARVPGPFETAIPLYLDDAGFREVSITVKGTAYAGDAAAK